MSDSSPVEIVLEFGHTAVLKDKPVVLNNGETHTHDWHLLVKDPLGGNIENYLEKVVFVLYEKFPNPKRHVNAPPFEIRESGYESFTVSIDLYFKISDTNIKKTRVNYELILQPNKDVVPPDDPTYQHEIKMCHREKLTIPGPVDEDFKRRLLLGRVKLVELLLSLRRKSSSNISKDPEKENLKERDNHEDRNRSRYTDKSKYRDGHKDRDRSRDRSKERDAHKKRDRSSVTEKSKERETYEDRDWYMDTERNRYRDTDKSKERDTHKDWNKSKDTEKSKQRDTHEDRDRSSDTEKSKARDTHKDRDRSRDTEDSREGDTHEDKNRSRDTEKSKERDTLEDRDRCRDTEKSKERDTLEDRDRSTDTEKSNKRDTHKDWDRSRDTEKSKERDTHPDWDRSTDTEKSKDCNDSECIEEKEGKHTEDVKNVVIMEQVRLEMEVDIKEEAENVRMESKKSTYVQMQNRENKRPKPETYCLLCQEYGHILNDACIVNATCLSCGVKGHVRRDCYCMLCQEPGHVFKVDCTTCFNCGKKGHVRRDCTSLHQ